MAKKPTNNPYGYKVCYKEAGDKKYTRYCCAVHYPKEAAKVWVTETAYADEDGVVHETDPAIDTAALLKLQQLIGGILIVR